MTMSGREVQAGNFPARKYGPSAQLPHVILAAPDLFSRNRFSPQLRRSGYCKYLRVFFARGRRFRGRDRRLRNSRFKRLSAIHHLCFRLSSAHKHLFGHGSWLCMTTNFLTKFSTFRKVHRKEPVRTSIFVRHQNYCRIPARDVVLCHHSLNLRSWHGCCARWYCKKIENFSAAGANAKASLVIFKIKKFST